ncbi:ABC transporter ATP-binding protein/permease [Micromonospora sp. NBC_00330]|uniref:ABC transporter ATP-binding protein n=1 Tax=Micromonospora sp. NBC_00330 TaxID=2903585 RepID=UPI002E2DA04C|nr:ABC transporter ATP-binding protein [Micromonospora sp. NBC_00330]
MSFRLPTGIGAQTRLILAAGVLAVRAAPRALACYLVLTALGALFPVATAWLMKVLLDDLAGLRAGGGTGSVTTAALGVAVTGVAVSLLPHVTQYLRAEMDRAVGLLAQDRLYAAVERFVGLGRFEEPRFLNRLRLAQMTAGAMPNQVVDGLLGVIRSVVMMSGFLGSLLLVDPSLALLVFGAGLPALGAEIALSRMRARMFWQIGPAERREMFYSQLLSNAAAAKEVRLFGTGPFLRGLMLAERRVANSAKRAVDRREAIVQSALGLTAGLAAGAGMLWAVDAAVRGELSIGDITLFVTAIVGVQGALAALAGELARTHQAMLMFEHHRAVVDAPADLPVLPAAAPVPPLTGAIELRDVWFRYSDEHPWILRGVSLRIPYGQTLAVVGLNGAGKSTIAKLLCRLYDPNRGAVLWDGIDIRDVDVTALRRRIAAVFQDYMEYDLSAAQNIALGDIDTLHDRARLVAAARRAGIHDLLDTLPRGYDTLLSRSFFGTTDDREDPTVGVVLSGGQWQRLALARALVRDQCDLMILDEPSAGLDAEAEAELHRSLQRYRAGRTSLLVSHRLGAVRDADWIVVLADGKLVEDGDHSSLMAARGAYARLFSLQAAGYQLPAGGREQSDDHQGPPAERLLTTVPLQ